MITLSREKLHMFFFLSCYFIRGNVGVGSLESNPQLHSSVTLRYMNLIGPTARLNINNHQIQSSFGLELSTAMLFHELLSIDEQESRTLQLMYLYSAVGVDVFSIVHSKEHKIQVSLSPYIQIHSPPFCLIRTRNKQLCFTGYGEYQYQLSPYPSPHHSWQIGTSVHYGFGRFPS